MGDSITPDKPDRPDIESDPTMPPEEQLEAIKEHYASLLANHQQLQQQLKQAKEQEKELKKKLDRLNRRNQALKSASFYVATIEELLDEDTSQPHVVLKQHGNKQEVFTELPDQFADAVDPGDRVTVDDNFVIQTSLTNETDTRAKAMEVAESPGVLYSDIGGLDDELRDVREAVEQPLNNPDQFDSVGIDPPKGVLLHGPPGTGKTLLAKAVAEETDATFIKLAGSELVQKFIGEGARLVRDLFELAEEKSPAIIFIDEIDAIASKRTDSKTSGDAEVQRTLMQLLAKMDGFEDRGDVRMIAATNRFDMLDEAILRPGRFDRLIEVDVPNEDGRRQIFKIHTRNMNLDDAIDFDRLASDTDGFSGADIENITTEAGMFAIRNGRTTVTSEDFDTAIDRLREDRSDIGKDTTDSPLRYAY